MVGWNKWSVGGKGRKCEWITWTNKIGGKHLK